MTFRTDQNAARVTRGQASARRILLAGALAFELALHCSASFISFSFTNYDGTPMSNTMFIVEPKGDPAVDAAGNLTATIGLPSRLTTGLDGRCTNWFQQQNYFVISTATGPNFLGRGYCFRAPFDTGPTVYPSAGPGQLITGPNYFVTLYQTNGGAGGSITFNNVTNALGFTPIAGNVATNSFDPTNSAATVQNSMIGLINVASNILTGGIFTQGTGNTNETTRQVSLEHSQMIGATAALGAAATAQALVQTQDTVLKVLNQGTANTNDATAKAAAERAAMILTNTATLALLNTASNVLNTAIGTQVLAQGGYNTNDATAKAAAERSAMVLTNAATLAIQNLSSNSLYWYSQYLQAQIGKYTNSLTASGASGSITAFNGVYDYTGAGAWTNSFGAYFTNDPLGGARLISGGAICGAVGGWVAGSPYTNIIGVGNNPTVTFFTNLDVAGANMTISNARGTKTFSAASGGATALFLNSANIQWTTLGGSNVATVPSSTFDAFNAAFTQGGANTNDTIARIAAQATATTTQIGATNTLIHADISATNAANLATTTAQLAATNAQIHLDIATTNAANAAFATAQISATNAQIHLDIASTNATEHAAMLAAVLAQGGNNTNNTTLAIATLKSGNNTFAGGNTFTSPQTNAAVVSSTGYYVNGGSLIQIAEGNGSIHYADGSMLAPNTVKLFWPSLGKMILDGSGNIYDSGGTFKVFQSSGDLFSGNARGLSNYDLTMATNNDAVVSNQVFNASALNTTNQDAVAKSAGIYNSNAIVFATGFGTANANGYYVTEGTNFYVNQNGFQLYSDASFNFYIYLPATGTNYSRGGGPIGTGWTVVNGTSPGGTTYFTNGPLNAATQTLISGVSASAAVAAVQAYGAITNNQQSPLAFGNPTNSFVGTIIGGASYLIDTNSLYAIIYGGTSGQYTNNGSGTYVQNVPGSGQPFFQFVNGFYIFHDSAHGNSTNYGGSFVGLYQTNSASNLIYPYTAIVTGFATNSTDYLTSLNVTTNYNAANMAPLSGFTRISGSNNVIWFVNSMTTNHIP